MVTALVSWPMACSALAANCDTAIFVKVDNELIFVKRAKTLRKNRIKWRNAILKNFKKKNNQSSHNLKYLFFLFAERKRLTSTSNGHDDAN